MPLSRRVSGPIRSHEARSGARGGHAYPHVAQHCGIAAAARPHALRRPVLPRGPVTHPTHVPLSYNPDQVALRSCFIVSRMSIKGYTAPPGTQCQPDTRKGSQAPAHLVVASEDDIELQSVYRWLMEQPIEDLLRVAVDSAIQYVLDGARTWRFDLLDKRVDSDERSSVGTKLQYHVIEELGLQKVPPLDTEIDDVPVEIKGSVQDVTAPWMIPREGQCQVTLLIQADLSNWKFAAWLMRTHRVWLRNGRNQDGKRSPRSAHFREYALPVVTWSTLPPQPLKRLTQDQLKVVFDDRGLQKRSIDLFRFLPDTVIPRSSLATVGAGLHDPMRRLRQTKAILRDNHSLIVLVGKWISDREIASSLGHKLGPEDWVAIPAERFAESSIAFPSVE